jgi:hypothetical protein
MQKGAARRWTQSTERLRTMNTSDIASKIEDLRTKHQKEFDEKLDSHLEDLYEEIRDVGVRNYLNVALCLLETRAEKTIREDRPVYESAAHTLRRAIADMAALFECEETEWDEEKDKRMEAQWNERDE